MRQRSGEADTVSRQEIIAVRLGCNSEDGETYSVRNRNSKICLLILCMGSLWFGKLGE